MTAYRRVTFEDRCQIKAYIGLQDSAAEIARKLGFHKSTISREIKRNFGRVKYSARTAEKRARIQFQACRRKKVVRDELKILVHDKLGFAWSPEQIAGRLLREVGRRVSHETVYKYAIQNADDPKVRLGLRKYKKKGSSRLRRREQPSWRIPIAQRPTAIDARTRFGDWERDLFYANGEALIACTDRKSRYVKLQKVIKPSSVYLTEQTKRMLQGTGRLLSLTNDNGPEFEDGYQFDVPVYYCEPRKPQQRGSVENTIGLIRQFIKKTTDITTMTDKDIQRIEDALNYRPRKCLDYRTPYEVFNNTNVALVS